MKNKIEEIKMFFETPCTAIEALNQTAGDRNVDEWWSVKRMDAATGGGMNVLFVIKKKHNGSIKS